MAGTSAEGPYEGCDITCDVGNMLLVDPRNGGDWRCIREGPNYCPGKFNTGMVIPASASSYIKFSVECACEGGPDECPIGDCECDAQLRVSHDCKTAKYGLGLLFPCDLLFLAVIAMTLWLVDLRLSLVMNLMILCMLT